MSLKDLVSEINKINLLRRKVRLGHDGDDDDVPCSSFPSGVCRCHDVHLSL